MAFASMDDALLGQVYALAEETNGIRLELVAHKVKEWRKEAFSTVPLLWDMTDVQKANSHAVLICVQTALALCSHQVASAFGAAVTPPDVAVYLHTLCKRIITSGYSIPTDRLHDRIKGLDKYLKSVLKGGGRLSEGKRTICVGKREAPWPALCVAHIYDPLSQHIGYTAMCTRCQDEFDGWVDAIYTQSALPVANTVHEKVDFLLNSACSVIVRMGVPSARTGNMLPITLTWMTTPVNLGLPSVGLTQSKRFKHPTEVVTPCDTSHVHPGAFLDSSDDEELLKEDMRMNPSQYDPQSVPIDPGSFAGMYRGMTTLEASRMSGQPVVQAPAPQTTLTPVQQAVYDDLVRDYTSPADLDNLPLFLKKLYG
jgi:hypothetical protein